MIKIDNLEKNYKGFSLSISMEITPGRVTGIVGRNGVERQVILNLTDEELLRFRASCDFLKQTYEEIVLSGAHG